MPSQSQMQPTIENELYIPKMYMVRLHNDDFTTMDFVTMILMKVFHKTASEATAVMMEVHEKGSSPAGIYTYDIAITKKMQTDQLAKEKGYPLKLTIEEATQ